VPSNECHFNVTRCAYTKRAARFLLTGAGQALQATRPKHAACAAPAPLIWILQFNLEQTSKFYITESQFKIRILDIHGRKIHFTCPTSQDIQKVTRRGNLRHKRAVAPVTRRSHNTLCIENEAAARRRSTREFTKGQVDPNPFRFCEAQQAKRQCRSIAAQEQANFSKLERCGRALRCHCCITLPADALVNSTVIMPSVTCSHNHAGLLRSHSSIFTFTIFICSVSRAE
jgi:hypothetical protein